VEQSCLLEQASIGSPKVFHSVAGLLRRTVEGSDHLQLPFQSSFSFRSFRGWAPWPRLLTLIDEAYQRTGLD
jgi:hypothetical protein